MIADVPIQLATRADALQIAQMSRDSIEVGLPWGWTERRVARAIQDPEMNVVVVREAGRVAGFGIMGYLQDDAHLLLLAVRQERRRSGIASAILVWLEQVAQAAGASRIRVESRQDNMPARSFYNEHGYHERAIRKRMYSGAADGVMLEKWLRAQPSDDATSGSP
jgi:[ribosomal protein S18]-alanine N-acetyltransferase